MNNRAVSDVVGYVLIFSTLIISVGLVGVLGTGAITDLNQYESDGSAQRAMETLGTNFNDLQSGDVARASEVRLAGGSMSVTSGSTVDITVRDDTDSIDWTGTHDTGALQYRGNNRNFVYENGAVAQQSEGYSRLLRRPAFLCSSERAVISVVTIWGESQSVSKDGSITVHGRMQSTTLNYRSEESSEVEIEVDSTAQQAWKEYFTNHPHWDYDSASESASCSADTVYVRETTISIDFLT